MSHQPFHDPPDIVNRNEGHLHIDLRKLRLTVRTKVFIPEAPNDLNISVKTGDHQNLFEQLRGLREGIKMSWIEPAGNEVVPGPFGCALREHRRLAFQKPQTV